MHYHKINNRMLNGPSNKQISIQTLTTGYISCNGTASSSSTSLTSSITPQVHLVTWPMMCY
ncbi:unnamed protein product [Coffea canephora]|uniref:Uncharacterized protein n=1 Tax=Coffea canephora TaxID=49390 RepID=A0A068U8P7_COFCA|nr:unnamed protein product [Coffea canephora]